MDGTRPQSCRGRTGRWVTAAEWFAGGHADPVRPGIRARTDRARRPPRPRRRFGFSSGWPPRGRTRTPCGSRCCPDSRTAPTAGRRWTGCSATTSARGCTWSRSGRATRTSPGTTRTPPSSARTWSRRCGGTTACAAPSSSPSTTPRSRCSSCCAASWSGPPPADTTGPVITAAFMVNGGLFADAHTHPWQGTPLLRTPLGALGDAGAQRSPRVFDTALMQARLYSRSYRPTPDELAELRSAITRRDGAAFLHNAAGFVAEHRRHARALGSRRDRPRPGRHGRPLRRRQRRGPLRAPADPGHPRARARRPRS